MSFFSSKEIILSNSSLKKDIKLQSNNVMFGILSSHSYSKFFSCVDLIHLNMACIFYSSIILSCEIFTI